ncbi:MAG: hypothetical protein IJP48_05780 [Synergistaceae bacterium]|nr:hypothetical protein [Synergistaceae bacterium]
MRIANNLPALTAFNALNAANKKLQKTITQLSTGLRINSASDDAAGFAVSERMRSQISGLDTALRNSQDGISLLQTAEGALGETNSMLQRMRELAVQASNDSLTSNDRNYIQLEINELQDQINRIAGTTQFNKKRILDGSSGTLWASSDLNLKARVNGGLSYIDEFGQKVSSEGNYRIEVNAEPGECQVQKSNIMNIAEEKTQTVIKSIPITETHTQTLEREYVINLSTMLDNSETPASSGNGWEFTTDSNGNDILRIYSNGKFNLTGTAPSGMYVNVERSVTNAAVFLSGVTIDNSENELPAFLVNPGANVDMYLSGTNSLISGERYAGLVVPIGAELTISSQNGDFSANGTLIAKGGYGGAGIGGGNGYDNARTGTITINGGTIQASGGAEASGIGCGSSGGPREGSININGGNINAFAGDYSSSITTSPYGYYYNQNAGAGIGCAGLPNLNNMQINITGGIIEAKGGTVTLLYDGEALANIGASGIGGSIDTGSGIININSDVSVTAVPGAVSFFDNWTSHFPLPAMRPEQSMEAENIGLGWKGLLTQRNINLDAGLSPPLARTVPDKDIITITENSEIIIGYDTKEITEKVTSYRTLNKISQFYDSNGVFLLSQPQTLTITQGNGQTASITLYETDTMNDVAAKINNAIANSLGQGSYTDNPNKFCTLSDGTQNTSESVYSRNPIYDDNGNLTGYEIYSTMLVRSVIPGKAGDLTFSGDEDLLKALGLNTIQSSSESTYTASIYDAHSGRAVTRAVKLTGNILKGVVNPNIDIEFDPMAGINASWDESTKRYILSDSENYSAALHLKDNSITFQTGADNGEDFIIQLGDTSSLALGIEGVNLLTRESASRSITILDQAINKVSSQRAKIGAYNNALEHTIENLTTTSLNLAESESRIRDTDMSKSILELVRLQILNQSGTSMLAQANQLPQNILSLLQ